MRVFLNISLFLFALVIFKDKSLALPDYEIKQICKREKKWLTCEKKLKEKRFDLQKGNQIEIPVIPYKK